MITKTKAMACGLLALLSAAACSRQVEVASGGEVASVTPVNANTLPAGSTINARLNTALSTENSKVGDTFTLTVADNVVAQNGAVVVPAGATIEGRVAAVDDSDHPADKAYIQLQLHTLRFGGQSYSFGASVQSVASVEESSASSGQVARRAGTGAAIGAAIGAIISGGELDDIIKGGAVGAAAGTVISLGAGDVEHRLPAGTMLTIRSTQSVALR
jgi:hypothetical protein